MAIRVEALVALPLDDSVYDGVERIQILAYNFNSMMRRFEPVRF